MENKDYEISTGNIFADLDLPEADRLKVKADLAVQIIHTIKTRALTQQEAARRMGISQPKVSALLAGEFPAMSERKLMDCLTRLGFDVEISIRPSVSAIGHLTVAQV